MKDPMAEAKAAWERRNLFLEGMQRALAERDAAVKEVERLKALESILRESNTALAMELQKERDAAKVEIERLKYAGDFARQVAFETNVNLAGEVVAVKAEAERLRVEIEARVKRLEGIVGPA